MGLGRGRESRLSRSDVREIGLQLLGELGVHSRK